MVGLATITGATVTVLQYRNPQGPDLPLNHTSSSTTTSTETLPTPVGAAVKLKIGACLESLTDSVPCDSPHAWEVIGSASDCNDRVLFDYLGAITGIDSLMDSVRLVPQPASETCVLQLPAKVETSMRDALLSVRGDSLRRCFDARADRESPCSAPHTTETTFRAPEGTNTLNCLERSSAFMDRPAKEFAQSLSFKEVRVGKSWECRASIKGANLLTASLRRLGQQELPSIPSP